MSAVSAPAAAPQPPPPPEFADLAQHASLQEFVRGLIDESAHGRVAAFLLAVARVRQLTLAEDDDVAHLAEALDRELFGAPGPQTKAGASALSVLAREIASSLSYDSATASATAIEGGAHAIALLKGWASPTGIAAVYPMGQAAAGRCAWALQCRLGGAYTPPLRERAGFANVTGSWALQRAAVHDAHQYFIKVSRMLLLSNALGIQVADLDSATARASIEAVERALSPHSALLSGAFPEPASKDDDFRWHSLCDKLRAAVSPTPPLVRLYSRPSGTSFSRTIRVTPTTWLARAS